jgi:hypothetical protein
MNDNRDRKAEVLVVLDLDGFFLADGLLDEVEQVVDPDGAGGCRDELTRGRFNLDGESRRFAATFLGSDITT